jgi:cyclic pyranopterin phosphate synthase
MLQPLIDTFGRVHNNLRISVTDRCNLRCIYCMPEEVVFQDKRELLSFEEIKRFVEIMVPLGIDKIRLTGGEPLLRQQLPRLVTMLAAVEGIKDLALTTNGLTLAKEAQALHDAGLRRITVSLDTLDPARFRQLTRRDGLEQVLHGILTARRVGFDPIKINAVCIRGINEPDVAPLARFARQHGLEMRFIEYMPIGDEHWERGKVYFAHEILDQLDREICPLVPAKTYDRRAPAMEFSFVDGGGKVGIIASVSRPFCMSCNRIRLTADGKLRNCLFALEETDIKTLLREGVPVEAIQRAVRQSVLDKWEGHEINTSRFVKPLRTMHAIGG